MEFASVCFLFNMFGNIFTIDELCISNHWTWNYFSFQSSDDGQVTRTGINSLRKTKIICTIGPSTSSRDMIWKLAETGMNVARLNMSHGDHASHQKTIDLVKEYNSQFEEKVVAIMLDTKVCTGWLLILDLGGVCKLYNVGRNHIFLEGVCLQILQITFRIFYF